MVAFQMATATSCPLLLLPAPLLDNLVHDVLQQIPSAILIFLASLGRVLHASASRILFRQLRLLDAAQIFNGTTLSILSPLISNPKRYGPAVKTIIIEDPIVIETIPAPADARSLHRLFQACPNLEEFVWEASLPPPDGLCEMLAPQCRQLNRFSNLPSDPNTSFRRLNGCKWDAPSLPLLSCLTITSMSLVRLSKTGARALALFLTNISADSQLDHLDLDFTWLDDGLCKVIAGAGYKIRSLVLGTAGTKLTDKGIISILDQCDSLEELTLDDVQGRLSRSLWSKPASYPSGLRRLRVIISNAGPRHSWASDHLDSISLAPLETLDEFSVTKREASLTKDGVVTAADDLQCAPIPTDLIDKLSTCTDLKVLGCDYWLCSIDNMKRLLECTKLESLKLYLDAPFSKLISSNCSTLSCLRALRISINPIHAPGNAPSRVTLSSSEDSSTHRNLFPVHKKKSHLRLLDSDPPSSQIQVADIDPSMPAIRDIKRFARKMAQLSIMEWGGRVGRGTWVVSRPIIAGSTKVSTNIDIDYIPPGIASSALASEQWRENATRVARDGHKWTGEQADCLQTKYQETEVCSASSTRKQRKPSISTSSTSTSDIITPTTPSRPLDDSFTIVQVCSPPSPHLSNPFATDVQHWEDIGFESFFQKQSPLENTRALTRSAMANRSASLDDGLSQPSTSGLRSNGRANRRSKQPGNAELTPVLRGRNIRSARATPSRGRGAWAPA